MTADRTEIVIHIPSEVDSFFYAENLSWARVTQIMSLLKLPVEVKEFLTGLQDPAEIRRYSERRLRKILKSETRIKALKN